MNDRNPIIKFDPNARVQVFFPDINSRKITTKFGERTVYDVQSQGQSFALFADDRLHSMILASGLKSNLVLEISRNQQGDQKWTEVTNTETGMSIDSTHHPRSHSSHNNPSTNSHNNNPPNTNSHSHRIKQVAQIGKIYPA